MSFQRQLLHPVPSPDLFFTSSLASKFHRREIGTGFLRAFHGSEVGCRFVLEQVPAGGIVLRCLLDTVQSEAWQQRPRPRDSSQEHVDLVLDLVTNADYRLENFRFHPVSRGGSYSYEIELSGIDLRFIGKRHFDRPVAFAEFSIVNFEVDWGHACVRLSSMWHWDRVTVLRLGDRECWLRAVEKDSDIIEELKASKGIAVTAKAMLPLHSLEEWDDIKERIDDLCTVLTLLSGNRVSWVSARAIDSMGYSQLEQWRHSVTNPYTTHDVVNTFSTGPMHLNTTTTQYVPIIERMVSHFKEAQQEWNIRAAVNTWHETVISTHFPEQRGLLISTCMEMLRTRYLKHGGRETILNAELFEKQKNTISKELKKILKGMFPVQEGWSEEQKKAHIGTYL